MVKVLVTLLTSSKFNYLKLAIECVEQQLSNNLDITLIIIVNTLKEDYYQKVKDEIKDYKVIRTESNGRPGKGHNSLFEVFNEEIDYDYLLPVDGDDFLYPTALRNIEQYIKYKPDALIFPYCDSIKELYPDNNLSFPIKQKFYLYHRHFLKRKKIKELWLDTNRSPFEKGINNTTAGGRLCLLSRKCLQLNLHYGEDMKLFDDINPFLQLFEAATIQKNYNIFLLNDYNIYLYNRLNEDAASWHYKPEHRKKEEENFSKSVKNKFLSIRNWQLENTFNFLECDDGFTIDDKINFCKKIANKVNTKDIKIKVKNFALFKKYAIDNKNKEMFEYYNNYFQNHDD